MSDSGLDLRPFHERPDHWHYRKSCWQRNFIWEERVAMSELGIGPERVRQNEQKRVSSVDLRWRTISDEVLANLAAFEFLTTVLLIGSTATDECLDHLKNLPHLKWLWIADTQITERAARTLEKTNSNILVFRKGEGAIRTPSGRWIKISEGWWPTGKPWWKFW